MKSRRTLMYFQGLPTIACARPTRGCRARGKSQRVDALRIEQVLLAFGHVRAILVMPRMTSFAGAL